MAFIGRFFALVVLAAASLQSSAFVRHHTQKTSPDVALNGIFDKVGGFFEELDAFVDDATSRRLGAGASFYGKRKSNFYGDNDKGKKRDRTRADPSEDYRGPTSSGFFKWVPDENGQLQPVTRMKEKNLSRNVNWEKVYAGDDEN
jgi:hypothetical protein